MIYDLQTIGERVFALLDENIEIDWEKTEYADPGMSVGSLIPVFLEDAALITLASAPLWKITECRHLLDDLTTRRENSVSIPGATVGPAESSDTLILQGNNRALMKLPDRFLRLVNIRLSCWTHGVSTPLATGGEEHSLRHATSPAGMRRRSRPAVALQYRGNEKYIEMYAAEEDARLIEFDWIEAPRIEGDTINLPQGVFSDVCVKTAEMIRLTINPLNE